MFKINIKSRPKHATNITGLLQDENEELKSTRYYLYLNQQGLSHRQFNFLLSQESLMQLYKQNRGTHRRGWQKRQHSGGFHGSMQVISFLKGFTLYQVAQYQLKNYRGMTVALSMTELHSQIRNQNSLLRCSILITWLYSSGYGCVVFHSKKRNLCMIPSKIWCLS